MTEDEFFNKYGWWCVAVVVILFTIAVGFAACDMITEAEACDNNGYQWVENIYEDSIECGRVSAYGGETEYKWIVTN